MKLIRQEGHNNSDENIVAACHTCHPYQHVGEVALRTDTWAETLGKKTALAYVPEVSAADMNLLQRALGAALADPSSKEEATQIFEALLQRCEDTKDRFGTSFASDFAGAMARLTDEHYAARAEALEGERLIFSEQLLERLGREFMADNPSLPTSTWRRVAEGAPSPERN